MTWRIFFILLSVLVLPYLITSCGSEDGSSVTSELIGVRGTVIDATGAPIPNATIIINDIQEAISTDEKGDFYIEIPTGEQLLTIYNGNLIHATITVNAVGVSFVELDYISPDDLTQTISSGLQANLSSSKFDCGAWGQDNCNIFDWEYWNGGLGILNSCDRGLKCEDRSLFKLCVLGSGVCRNDDRWQANATTIQSGWAYNAIVEQRKIARYEPINWLAFLGAHNAFNNQADGYFLKPNQIYSMTDQLRMGARALMIDVHHICDLSLACEIRLSHAEVSDSGIHWGASPNDRHFGFGIIEIKQWLDNNPGEVIVLYIEEHLENDPESKADYAWILEHFLSAKMLRRSEKPQGRWPTLVEMRDMKRQVVVIGSALYDEKDYFFKEVKTPWKSSAPKKFDPQLCEMDGTYSFTDNDEKFVAVEESRYIIDIPLFDIHYNGYESAGVIAEDCSGAQIPCAETSQITACGNSQTLVDYLGGGVADATYPIGDRFTGLVWSWKEGVRGWEEDNQAAVLETSSGRWIPRELSETHHYACGHLREGAPSTWADSTQLTEWRVTQEIGPYRDGGMQCAKEFGSEFVFSVPVNAPQNEKLLATHDINSEHDVWLAYRDIKDAENDVDWDRDVPCITGVIATFTELWPPNHIMVPIELEILHQCTIEPECKISSISSDDPTVTDEDWRILDESPLALELRSERIGWNHDGRTYSLDIECLVDEDGRVNMTGIDILVPHDQKVSQCRAGPRHWIETVIGE